MPFLKDQSQSQYWALFVCILVVAALSRFQGNVRDGSDPFGRPVQQSQTPTDQQLKAAVSGCIGVDTSRGDSVYVINR